MISPRCLEKPPQKTLRLSHSSHSAGAGNKTKTGNQRTKNPDTRFRLIPAKKGEEHLYELGRPKQWAQGGENKPSEASQQRRIAELERQIGRQQMEIRFLDRALRRVEEQRQRKNDGGGEA